MGKSGKLIAAIIIALVLGGVLFFISSKNGANDTSNPATGNTSTNDSSSPADVTITYDGASFQLSASTIKSGGKVRVVNSSQKDLDFNSDPHPVHTDNPELNAGDIAAGESKTFTLTAKGSWGFHNHLNSSQRGSIEVQ